MVVITILKYTLLLIKFYAGSNPAVEVFRFLINCSRFVNIFHCLYFLNL